MSTSRRTKPKSRKAAALAALKSGRSGGLDDFEVAEDDAVYDYVDEDEYRELVDQRRRREDFVVDDDGLGYQDDGEEFIGHEEKDAKLAVEEAEDDTKKRKKNNMTAEAIKKMRRQNLNSQAAQGSGKITKFLSHSHNTNASARPAINAKTSSNLNIVANFGMGADTLESLMNQTFAKKPQISGKKKGKRGVKKKMVHMEYMHLEDSAAGVGDGLDLDQEENMGTDMNITDDFMPSTPLESGLNMDVAANGISTESPHTSPKTSNAASVQKDEEKEEEVLVKRRTFARPQSTSRTSVTKTTSAAPIPQRTINTNIDIGVLEKALDVPSFELSMNTGNVGSVGNVDVSALLQIEDANDTVAKDIAEDGDTDAVVVDTETGQPRTYLPFYYLDLTETKPGVLTLFGKVYNPKTSEYHSSSVEVHNHYHNLYLLPHAECTLQDIFAEIPEVLGKIEFKCKPVTRHFCFGKSTGTKGGTQQTMEVLKVVYPATSPIPPTKVCEEGGRTFQKIYGYGCGVLERFLVKRKLKGPGWIKIYEPKSIPANPNWTSLHFSVHTPKNLTTYTPTYPTPPLRTVTLKIQTMLNPKTHTSEIVMVAAMIQNISLEGESSGAVQDSMVLVRPLVPHAVLKLPNSAKMNCVAMPNERALLSRLIAQIGTWDPDVLCGHNVLQWDLPHLLSRCMVHKIGQWSKFGRRRQFTQYKQTGHFDKEYNVHAAITGRLVCDSYLMSKELLPGSTSYGLSYLSSTQLNATLPTVDPMDIPKYYQTPELLVQLCTYTMYCLTLCSNLCMKLQVLPLTKQLTNIAGNVWTRTLRGNRAERNEYLLLHEFHVRKYLVPECPKRVNQLRNRDSVKSNRNNGSSRGREKAKYNGGLVLDPKKGLYDTFILLLDFNSLYPSIIQEYNLCFTTLDWTKCVTGNSGTTVIQEDNHDDEGDADMEASLSSNTQLPDLPSPNITQGILPRVLAHLVSRRRNVKQLLKQTPSSDTHTLSTLEVRQKALKLTANSMYGCLGYTHSRFLAQPIAALITSLGRDALQSTVQIATNELNLEVIYGDTDSVMINTAISSRCDPNDTTNSIKNVLERYQQVLGLGHKVKHAVNNLYKTLELEIDGVFQTMLLLKKKKYAAVTVTLSKSDLSKLIYAKETKGLDLVRRDWCVVSKECGRYVLDQILDTAVSGEAAVLQVESYLTELAQKMREGRLSLEQFVITKGLSKHPKDYPDANTQPHVWVAKRMLQNQQPVNVGDHIPYIICCPVQDGDESTGQSNTKKGKSIVQHAYHPDEISRDPKRLKPDVEWYLKQQILPPISRLCEPIEGIDQRSIGMKLGLDISQLMTSGAYTDLDTDEALVDYVPASALKDEERFKACDQLLILCGKCGEKAPFQGCFITEYGDDADGISVSYCGVQCGNEKCKAPYLGIPNSNRVSCFGRLQLAIEQHCRSWVQKHFMCSLQCDDITCGFVTQMPNLMGSHGHRCLVKGCRGVVRQTFPATMLYTQLKYLDSLFSLDYVARHLSTTAKRQLEKSLSKPDAALLGEVNAVIKNQIQMYEGNWVGKQFFETLFDHSKQRQSQSSRLVSP